MMRLCAEIEGAVFAYLTRFGDSVQERLDVCRQEAAALCEAGFWGAALIRAAAGIELTVKFFLARPLVQGAFLSDQWAQLLGVSVRTLQEWEKGRRAPSGAARTLLLIAAKNPRALRDVA